MLAPASAITDRPKPPTRPHLITRSWSDPVPPARGDWDWSDPDPDHRLDPWCRCCLPTGPSEDLWWPLRPRLNACGALELVGADR